MYSERHNFIYVHIPRTGGSSFRESIRQYVDIDFPSHFSLYDIKQEIGVEKWTKAKKFTIVRNTWARIYSLFCWSGYSSFVDFVCRIRQEAWTCSQLAFICDSNNYFGENNNLVEKPFKGKIVADKIFYYIEGIDRNLAEMSDYLGLHLKLNPHINFSHNRVNHREVYTDRIKEIIYDLYKEEIALLGFKF